MYKIVYSDNETMENFGNQVKDLLLEVLKKDDIISQEEFEEYSKKLTLIIKEPSKVSQFYNKILGKDNIEVKQMFFGRLQ